MIWGSKADAAFPAEPAPAGVATEDEVPFCVDWGTAPPSGAGESTIVTVDRGDGTPVTPGEVVTVGVTRGVAAGVTTAGSCCEELLAAAGVVLVAGAKLICGSRAGWMVAAGEAGGAAAGVAAGVGVGVGVVSAAGVGSDVTGGVAALALIKGVTVAAGTGVGGTKGEAEDVGVAVGAAVASADCPAGGASAVGDTPLAKLI